MQSDSSSDGDETGTEKQPNFKYTSRTQTHVMARNSGWSVEGLNYFNILYDLVVKDREENGVRFDDSLLKYYEVKNKNKKRKWNSSEENSSWRNIKMSDDLAGLVEETLGSNIVRLDGEIIGDIEEV